MPILAQSQQQKAGGQVEQKKNMIRILPQNPPQQQFQQPQQLQQVQQLQQLQQLQQPPRQIQDIMQYFYSERDQFIEQQFRNYLQQECNIDEMFKEYIPKQYQMLDIPEITSELDGYIRVRGDGNCFYNTFIYQFLIIVLQKSQEDFKIWKDKFKQIQFVIQFEQTNPFNDEDYKQMNNAFFQLIEAIYQQNSQFRIKDFQQKYSTNWNFLYQLSIIFCRSIISKCMEIRRRQDKEKEGLYDFAIQEVQKWELDCNYNELVLDCINKIVNIPLKLYIFEKDSFRMMNYETGSEKETTVYILFRQGHYVIPKVKKIEKTNQSIVSYHQKFQIYQRQQEIEQIINKQKNEINNLQSAANILQNELQDERRKNHDLQTQERDLKNKIGNLQGQLQSEQKSKTYIESLNDRQNNDISQLKQEIQQLKNKLSKAIDDVQNYQDQNQMQKDMLKNNLTRIEGLNKQITDLNWQLEKEKQNQQTRQQSAINKNGYSNIKMQIEQIGEQHQNEKIEEYKNQNTDILILNFHQLPDVVRQVFKQEKINSLVYYQFKNFYLAILVGYIQYQRDNLIFKLKKFRPYSDKQSYLIENFSKFNYSDLSSLNEQVAQIFFQYIIFGNNNYISDVSLSHQKISYLSNLLEIGVKFFESPTNYSSHNTYYSFTLRVIKNENKYYVQKII